MATYITLLKYTQKGIENIKEGPARLDAAKAAIKAAGGEMKAFYLTMGSYDAVSISEAPDDETATAVMLGLASLGNVRTQTLRAFTSSEMEAIVSKASSAD